MGLFCSVVTCDNGPDQVALLRINRPMRRNRKMGAKKDALQKLISALTVASRLVRAFFYRIRP